MNILETLGTLTALAGADGACIADMTDVQRLVIFAGLFGLYSGLQFGGHDNDQCDMMRQAALDGSPSKIRAVLESFEAANA